jgi:predicted TIM-barrel fold metal-dependent hydrolase
MSEMPKIISMDDHLIEPPDLWQSRLPAKYKDEGPRVVNAPRGKFVLDGANYREVPGDGPEMASWWHYEDHIYQLKLTIACPGIPPEEVHPIGVTFEDVAPGCYQPKARIADMDKNHVDGSLCFPNYPRFCGQLFAERKNKDLSKLCVEAYNDFMVEEWCGDSDGKLIPLCVVPLWDVELAAAEIRRNAARGVRAVAFSELPSWLGYPSIPSGYWDPFLEACEETGTVICMHIGSGTKLVTPSPESGTMVMMGTIFCNTVASMCEWIFSGKLDRFPKLKLLWAESQIGWIPYLLERLEEAYHVHQWAQNEYRLPNPPSYYYLNNCFGCFFKDAVGIDLIDKVGVDNILFETDYPHQDGTFPRSRQVAEETFGHLDQDAVYKIARGNAIRLLGLDRK